jgi:hypothetical protein
LHRVNAGWITSIFAIEIRFFLVLVRNPVFAADALAGQGFLVIRYVEHATALNAAELGKLGAVERGSEGGKSAFGTFQKTHEAFLLSNVVSRFLAVFERVIRYRWL